MGVYWLIQALGHVLLNTHFLVSSLRNTESVLENTFGKVRGTWRVKIKFITFKNWIMYCTWLYRPGAQTVLYSTWLHPPGAQTGQQQTLATCLHNMQPLPPEVTPALLYQDCTWCTWNDLAWRGLYRLRCTCYICGVPAVPGVYLIYLGWIAVPGVYLVCTWCVPGVHMLYIGFSCCTWGLGAVPGVYLLCPGCTCCTLSLAAVPGVYLIYMWGTFCTWGLAAVTRVYLIYLWCAYCTWSLAAVTRV